MIKSAGQIMFVAQIADALGKLLIAPTVDRLIVDGTYVRFCVSCNLLIVDGTYVRFCLSCNLLVTRSIPPTVAGCTPFHTMWFSAGSCGS